MTVQNKIKKDVVKKDLVGLEASKVVEASNIGTQKAWGGIGGSGKHASELVPELEEYLKKPELNNRAWGGIGGSGKHASELVPELEEYLKKPELNNRAWGGIGGSGKHASELQPERKIQ